MIKVGMSANLVHYNLMNLNRKAYRISNEAQLAQHSPMLDVFWRMSDAGPHTSLGSGIPPDDALPLERWQECFEHVLQRDGTDALQYRMPNLALREWIAEWMSGRGVDCSAEQIFISGGNQMGLQVASRALLEVDGLAVVERPTYTGILDVSQKRGCAIRTVDITPGAGLDLAGWRAACEREPRPAAAFLIADHHNPTANSLDDAARAELATISGETGVPIIEDDAYSALCIEGEPLPPIRAYPGGENSLYLGTFSKFLFPSLRLGWIVGPPELQPVLNGLRQTIDLMSSPYMEAVAAEFLHRGWLEEHLARMRHLLKVRLAAFQESLQEAFGGDAEWEEPEGGLFLWLRLPEEVDSDALFEEAMAQGVSYMPGNLFYEDGVSGANCLRLSYAVAPPAELREAAFALARALLPGKGGS